MNAKNPIEVLLAMFAICLTGCATDYTGKQHLDNQGNRVPEVGNFAPDFTLPDAHGGNVTLSQIRAGKSVLIIFYLGYDCPHCVKHLRDLANRQAEITNAGGQIIAISPDSIEATRQSIHDFGDFPFPLLSDPDKKVAKAFGLVRGNDVMFHGAFVIDEQGRIRFANRSDHPYTDIDKLREKLVEANLIALSLAR